VATDPPPTSGGIARLSHVQWENCVAQVMHLSAPSGFSKGFPSDISSTGFDNDPASMVVDPVQWLYYQSAAELLAADLVKDHAQYSAVVPQDPRPGPSVVDARFERPVFRSLQVGEAFAAKFTVTEPGFYGSEVVLRERAYGAVFAVDIDELRFVSAPAGAVVAGPNAWLQEGVHHLTVTLLEPAPGQELSDMPLRTLVVEGAPHPLGESLATTVERDEWLASFGRQVHRRPLSAGETDELVSLFIEGPGHFQSGDDFADGVRAVVGGVLQSPGFLYRLDSSEPYEAVSQLAFSLWNSCPDEFLLAEAAAGFDTSTRDAVVARMLDDDRAQSMVRDFHQQLLHTDGYRNIVKDADVFPAFTDSMADSMAAEVDAFVSAVVFGDGTVRDLLTRPQTFVNEDLASVYGVDGSFDQALVPVDLDPTRRAGLLTLSGFLAVNAGATQENLIARGTVVNHSFLCVDVPAPPQMVAPMPAVDPSSPLRDQVEAHTAACGGSCHTELINPLGAAFQHYDALGRYREDENGMPIDASASYDFPGQGVLPFIDAVELSERLAASPQAHGCYLSHWMKYLNGGVDDVPLLVELTSRSLEGEPIRDLVREMAMASLDAESGAD